MASGVYSRVSLVSTSNNAIVANTAVASGKIATVTLNIVNTTAATVNVSIAISNNPSIPAANDYIEYSTSILGYGVLERTGLVIPNGVGLSGIVSANGLTAVVYGYES